MTNQHSSYDKNSGLHVPAEHNDDSDGHGDHGQHRLVGTIRDDIVDGRSYETVVIDGWAGNDILYGGRFGGRVSGGTGNDTIYGYGHGHANPTRYQTHLMGDAGDDTLIFDVSTQVTDKFSFRFGHHGFGDSGRDRFVFIGVRDSNQRIVGRIDDFDLSQDEIWIEDEKLDLHAPPSNVRVVAHNGQQWLLINERILYALEGARHGSATVDAGGRNADSNEEDHFIDWPTAWAAGVPVTATVRYVDPVNFVPEKYYKIVHVTQHYHHTTHVDGPVIFGTNKADWIEGEQNNNDIIRAGGGDDYIWANRGDDTIFGGGGNDTIDGYMGHDVINGGHGNDIINGGKGHDLIYGGPGDDTIAGGSDNDTVYGGLGNDLIFGGSEDDELFGGQGNDTLFGGPGSDTLRGNSGDDFLSGDAGDDLLYGGLGDDTLRGGAGHDALFGGGGNDTLQGGPGHDSLHGGAGHDLLRGGAGRDTLLGGQGNDSLHGGAGNDLLRGGAGHDNLFGGTGNDTLRGGQGNDDLRGGVGDDVLFGGPGDDTLNGGAGTDVLSGGAGHDVFVFRSASHSPPEHADRITDFEPNIDKIDLSAMNLTYIGRADFSASRQLRWEHYQNETHIVTDLNGDGREDLMIRLNGLLWLDGVDFIL